MNHSVTGALHAPSLRRRMGSWLYEGVLLFGIFVAVGMVFSVFTDMRNAMGPQRVWLMAVLVLCAGLYFAFCWTHGGQTLAMKTWKVRVVDWQGRPVSAGRALFRYVLSWLWILPPLVIVAPYHLGARAVLGTLLGWVVLWALASRLHPSKQFWHDAWAGTRLVDAAVIRSGDNSAHVNARADASHP